MSTSGHPHRCQPNMGFEVSVGFRISLETSFNIRRVLVPVVDVVVVLSSVSTFILRTSWAL